MDYEYLKMDYYFDVSCRSKFHLYNETKRFSVAIENMTFEKLGRLFNVSIFNT